MTGGLPTATGIIGPHLPVLVLVHDAGDPPLRVGRWLTERGAVLDIRRLYDGDPLPADADGLRAIVSMGGAMGAWDDDVAPWLPATRALLADAVARSVPTLGICLGAQLLAAATGGTVTRGAEGPEIGAYLTARRDAAEQDPVFAGIPLTPDVMQYHYDVVHTLPPGATLLLSSTGYPHQAFRVGRAAWGTQFHFETCAADLRAWAEAEGRPTDTGRMGSMLDDADETMAVVWRQVISAFVDVALAAHPSTAPGPAEPLLGQRLPLLGGSA
jgi:GMP synthase-like glutamine amidotransferase